MKIEITKVQFEAIEALIDTASGMLGCMDEQTELEFSKAIMYWDRMLKKNKLRPRKFK